MIAVGVAIVLGILVLAILWGFGGLDNVQPPEQRPVVEERPVVEDRPVVGRLHAQSDEDLRTQQERCKRVRERCEPAARIVSADPRSDEALREALGVLQAVVVENERDGPLGVIASTELCNALIAANALPALEKFQVDADPLVAKRSSQVFHHVIPRIWSF